MRDDTGLRHWSKQVRVFAYGVLIALVLATGYFVFDNSRVANHSNHPGPNSVWLLRFTYVSKDERDDELVRFWEGYLTHELTIRLSDYDDLRLRPRMSTINPTTHEEVISNAYSDPFAYLVEGHTRIVDDQIHVSVKLFDVKGERYLWSNEYIEGFAIQGVESPREDQLRHFIFAEDNPLVLQIAQDIHSSVAK